MKEYIERDAFLDAVGNAKTNPIEAYDICEMLRIFPAADVHPVVYCKDCTVPHNKWTGCPKLGGLVTEPNFFCAFGETKGNSE